MELWQNNNMKQPLYLLILLIMPILIMASPKQLVCSYDDVDILESEENIFPGQSEVATSSLPIGSQISSESRLCSNYPNSSGNYCDNLKKLKNIKEVCLSSPELPRLTITFESGDLNTGNRVKGEFFYESCGNTYPGTGKFISDVKQITLSATPSIISIDGVASKTETFNVDRRSLKAGYGTSRLLSCRVQDVDVSQNQI